MRIFAATDIHGSRRAARMIREGLREHRPDVFVAGGDLTNFGPADAARELFAELSVPTLAVPGNCDPPQIVPVLEELGIGLHGRKVRVAGHTFVGIGGSNPMPFDTLFEVSEDDIMRILRPLMEPGVILVSHPPPKDLVDLAYDGEHAGSASVRAIVEEFQPPLVLCGHIHEARGTAKLGSSLVVNAGAAFMGEAAVIDVDGEVSVELV